MHIPILAYLFITFLVGNVSCGCPASTIPCGTACCDTSGPLFRYYCANPSKSLCCIENSEHDSNGICCRVRQENCGGTCCGGQCRTSWFFRFKYCFYATDAQCQNIGAEGHCTPSGGCSNPSSRCDGQCCHEVPR